MKAIIEIDMDNEAFKEGGWPVELRRMLKGIVSDLAHFGATRFRGTSTSLRDLNGNTCGRFEIVD